MNVWNRFGKLGKGVLDWAGDIGAAVASPFRFTYDIVTAPWNDDEQYNGFVNTLKSATVRAAKDVARPLGGIISAAAVTGQNIVREPVSALALYAGGKDKSLYGWTKAWENRNDISVGQSLLAAAGKPLSFLPDEITPEFIDSDFNIYNKKDRERAFNDSLFGKFTSGSIDTIAQFFSDPTFLAGKPIMALKAADSAFDAIKSLERVTAKGELNKYAKLADDFAANDTIWAAAHPWVRETNDPTTVSYLLGSTKTRDEAAYTMRAIMGDKSAIKYLEDINRPDLAEPLRVASGELTRSQLKTVLKEEKALLSQSEDMLQFVGRTPEEIAQDELYIAAWAQHDAYFDKLIRVADEAPAVEGIGRFGQTIGRELATGRAAASQVARQEAGQSVIKTYQPTPFHRAYHAVSWLQRERPSGMVNLNEGNSIAEVTAVVNRLTALSRSKKFKVITTGQAMSDDEAASYITRYAAAASPEKRAEVVSAIENRGYKILAEKYDIDIDTAQKLYDMHVMQRTGKLAEIRDTGFLYDAETDSMYKVPLLESQTANWLPMANFDEIDKVLKSNGNLLRMGVTRSTEIAEAFSDIWKASVLLRLGYPIRNAADSQLRIFATVGAMASLQHLGEGSANLIRNVTNSAKRSRYVDKFTIGKMPKYVDVKNQLQKVGKEMAESEKTIAKLEADLAANPNNLDAMGKLAIERQKLVARKATYEHNNKVLSTIEAKKIPSKKERIGTGKFQVESKFKAIDGEEYVFNDGFGGPGGGLWQELASSDRTFASLMDDFSTMYGSQYASKSRGVVRPDSANYYQEWAKAINEDFINSAVARKLIAGEDVQKTAAWLEDNMALRQRLGIGRTEALEHVAEVKTFVDNYIPDGYGIREQLRLTLPTGEQAKVSEEFLRKAITNPDELPVIHGHLMEEALNRTTPRLAKAMTNYLFKWLATKPEDAWARHPLFIDLYRKSLQKRMATMEQLKGNRFTRQEFADIQYGLEKAARADALKGVKGILYNVERRSNAAHMLRFVMPFFSAQENAVKTWLKIAADQPWMVARANVIWNAPNRSGLITDENGDPVPPGQIFSENDTMWLEVPESLKKLPLLGAGLSSLDQVGISKRSLDVMFQGNPFGVNLGPLAAIPAAKVMKMAPQLGDTLGFVFPYGPDDSLSQLLPTYMRRQLQRLQGQNNSDYAKMYQLIWTTEQHKARDESRPYKSEKQIKQMTDAYFNVRTAASLLLPFAPQFSSPYRYYMDKWRQYSEVYGLGADAKFLDDYPEFFDFAMTLSKNPTGSRATVEDVTNAKKYSDLIADVSSDDVSLIGLITRGSGSGKYNSTAYWWQEQVSISPGTPEKFRGKITPQEASRQNAARRGWAIWRKYMGMIDVELAKRGLSSVEQQGAEDLKYAKETIVRNLASEIDPVTKQPTGEPSAWYQDYRDVDGLKTARVVIGLKKIVSNEKFMNDNADDPTWKSVAVYMQIRQELAKSLAARPVTDINAKANADLKLMLDYYVYRLKQGDIEFGDIYDRYLSQDRIYDKNLDRGA